MIKDLHIKPDILNVIEEKVGKNMEPLGKGDNFLNIPIAYALRSKTDKWDIINLQRFYKAKNTVIRAK